MTGEQFQTHLRRLDLLFKEAAELFECNERTVRRWAHDELPVPTAVGLLLPRLLNVEMKEFRTSKRRRNA
jgi:hypothetical protein